VKVKKEIRRREGGKKEKSKKVKERRTHFSSRSFEEVGFGEILKGFNCIRVVQRSRYRIKSCGCPFLKQ
jgi:hypothetical protein